MRRGRAVATDVILSPNQPLRAAIEAAEKFSSAAKAANTLRGYEAGWRAFKAWCESTGCTTLPAHAGAVAAYLGALAAAGAKIKTIEHRAAAIGHFHRTVGFVNPTSDPGVRSTLQGIRRIVGSAPKKKAALTADLLAKAARKIPSDLAGLRDRALILLGFAAALRRSELVGLDVADIARHPKGIVLTLRRSKTDQAGEGIVKAVPHGHKLKAVEALDAWLHAAEITSGPVFRGVRGVNKFSWRLSDSQVARIVKKRVAQIGLDPALFAGHSLRSGFITSASDAGAELASIAKHAGHSKIETTFSYVQVADAFRNHSGKKFL
jgi:site-specific recombinase XerD